MTAILRRLLELIPTLIGVSILTFLLMRMTPGDPVRLMLGPEATAQAITAKRIELGFQRFTGGDEVTATAEAELATAEIEYTGMFLLHIDGATTDTVALSEGMVPLHFPGEEQPVYAALVSVQENPPAMTVRLEDQAGRLSDGVDHVVLINRVLENRPIVLQYASWLGSILLHGDMGTSITSTRPVTEEIFSRLPWTFLLAMVAMFFAVLTGLIVGTLSAVYPRTLLDNLSRIFVFIFLAMPSFWLGLELIIIFSRNLKWFPPAGTGHIGHLILPALTLGVGTGAFLSRILRSSMLQVLNMDYIRTAQAKGLSSSSVILKHALKNAMIPFITVAGLSLGALLGGSVIVETIFNWPGVGKLMIDSIKERDFPVTMGCVLVLATIFVLVNLLVDLLYVVLDPRIRLDSGEAR